MAKKDIKTTKARGRPRKTPTRVTVTLAPHHADELRRLAEEADVTLSALCAHVLERYAIQDRELMTNDIIAYRLEEIQERHMRQFAQRFGDVLLRQAHEVTALRRQLIAQAAQQHGPDAARELAERSWREAVNSLRPHTQRVRGEDQTSDQDSDPRGTP